MSQFAVPCALYRGGTSRGLLFHEKDLPKDWKKRETIFLKSIDALNLSQIDGVGGGNSHSSKIGVISPPSIKGVDVDYNFYQVVVGEQRIENSGTCGNFISSVGAFAVEEQLVDVSKNSDNVLVSVYDKNIQKKVNITVPLRYNKVTYCGDYLTPGIRTLGAKYYMAIMNPGGGKTGRTLPLGSNFTITTGKSQYNVSVVDVINPYIFIAGSDFGLFGDELVEELSKESHVLEEIEHIRSEVSRLVGLLNDGSPVKSIPKVTLVFKAKNYKTSDGTLIKKHQIDLIAKMISFEKFHPTFAGSGLFNLAAASLLPNTVPNVLFEKRDIALTSETIRIGQPNGTTEVQVELTSDREDVKYTGLSRTVRKIMNGNVFIP